MIDPIHSLAFSIQANRGVYAVLFGSGISRSAKIPTGWEITLELVRKLAAVAGEDCGAKPDDWYRAKYEREPDYSELLDAVAKTPAERQQLLRTYWEPTEAEREEGAKRPTPAHRAIAQLVAKGFVKVIVTTNFDRLMETALADVGIVPTVLSTPDQVHGTLPLIHTQCCLFKIHGDYIDTRIRNTPLELSAYPAEFDLLLDRIFDEFGLVVCGWSADWDEALRGAMTRAPSRRFATYWASRGKPGSSAQRLIDHRGAQLVSIDDADSFFTTVQQQVESLEEFSRPHPLSTDAAVASLKRYMSEPKYRIQHADLIALEVERALEVISSEKHALRTSSAPDSESITARVCAYDGICTTLMAMAIQAGQWAEVPQHQSWSRAIQALAITSSSSGAYQIFIELQKYPATLILYALGISAVESGRLAFLNEVLTTQISREYHEEQLAVQILPPFCLFEQGGAAARLLKGMDKRHAPLNDWIHEKLKPSMRRSTRTDEKYTLLFDKLEILIALCYGFHSTRGPDWYWVPPGAFGYRSKNCAKVLKEIDDSLSSSGDDSPYVMSRLFGKTTAECKKTMEDFNGVLVQIQREMR